MKDWWLGRQPRERRLLAGGGLILALVLLYVLVWEPWQQQLEQLRTDVATLQADLAWMQQAAAELGRLQANTPTTSTTGSSGMALATRVKQSARSAGLETVLRRLEPQADGSLRLWLDQVSFASLLPWLVGLRNDAGIRINEAQLERPGAARGDRINARLTLRGG